MDRDLSNKKEHWKSQETHVRGGSGGQRDNSSSESMVWNKVSLIPFRLAGNGDVTAISETE